MIIFLYGPDLFRSRRTLREMKEKFKKNSSDDVGSLETIDGKNANFQQITEKINTGSLFSNKRMVVIEDIFENKKTNIFSQLEEFLTKIQEQDNVIIFKDGEITKKNTLKADAKKLFSFLNKQKYSQEFKPLSQNGLINFAKNEAGKYDKKISKESVEELIRRTDGDLWLLSQSIKKASFSSDKELLSLEDIKEYSSEKFNENIFAFTDALSAKNKRLAIKILEEQYAAGVSDEYLISMLIRQFKILIRIKEAQTNGQNNERMIASQLKLHPFIVKKGLMQAKNFSFAQLIGYFNEIISLDRRNKTSQNDIKAEILTIIASL